MENNEDCASPVKVFTKKLDITAYNCFIYEQRGRKEGLRKCKKRELQHI